VNERQSKGWKMKKVKKRLIKMENYEKEKKKKK
jgi:hypothetical protein